MRIAIAKGRLLEPSLATFAAAAFDVPTDADLRTRRLVFTRGGIEWLFVKDCDVPVYVDHGAADAGIAGLDQIREHGGGAFEALALPFGRCRIMVIARAGAPRLSARSTIATKYPRIAREHVASLGLQCEVVPLAGSVELAAVLGLTTHVIDLVETGETVRVHNLELQELVAEIAPRLLVSRNFYRTSNKTARELIARVEAVNHDLVPSIVP